MKKNNYRLSLTQLAEERGYDDVTEMILDLGYDGIVPACCKEGCEVEPDGFCEHNCPSILVAANMI